LLANLYASALALPEVPDSALDDVARGTSDAEAALEKRVMDRVVKFPARDYWRIENSTDDTPGEKAQDDVARDLYLVYAPVRPLVVDLESKGPRRLSAVWSCRYMFWADWAAMPFIRCKFFRI